MCDQAKSHLNLIEIKMPLFETDLKDHASNKGIKSKLGLLKQINAY